MQFSSRLDWEPQPNRLGKLLSEPLRARLLDLTLANPTQIGLAYPPQLLEALTHPDGLRYDPAATGLLGARHAVCDYYLEAKGVEIACEDVVLCCSTSEAYAHLFRLLTNPGDVVLAPSPSYPLFGFLSQFECADLQSYPLLHTDRWRPHLTLHHERSRAVIAVHPNNPTGSFLDNHDIEMLGDYCRGHDLPLIVDEVFSDFVLDVDAPIRPTFADERRLPTFILSGLSKVLGLPQLKLSWIVIAGPDAWRQRARAALELLGDAFLSVSSPVQLALRRLLLSRQDLQAQILDRLQRNLAQLRRRLGALPILQYETEGGWYAVLRLPQSQSDEAWALSLLREYQVLVHPGYLFDFADEAVIVISLLTPPATWDEGLAAIAAAVQN